MTTRVALLAVALTLASFTGGNTLTAQAGASPTLPISIEVDPPGSGGCTLAEAITSANNDTAVGACAAGCGADVIHVPAGTHTITAVDNSIFGVLTGLPIVTSDITLVGDGADTTIIERPDGAPPFRLLHVWHLGAKLTVDGVTVRGGDGGAYGGGAIYAAGSLVVRRWCRWGVRRIQAAGVRSIACSMLLLAATLGPPVFSPAPVREPVLRNVNAVGPRLSRAGGDRW